MKVDYLHAFKVEDTFHNFIISSTLILIRNEGSTVNRNCRFFLRKNKNYNLFVVCNFAGILKREKETGFSSGPEPGNPRETVESDPRSPLDLKNGETRAASILREKRDDPGNGKWVDERERDWFSNSERIACSVRLCGIREEEEEGGGRGASRIKTISGAKKEAGRECRDG